MEVKIPSFVYIQRGAFGKLKKVLEKIGSENPMIVTDPVVSEILKDRISGLGIEKILVNEASILEARRVVLSLSYSDVDAIIGIGGGKVLDVSKVVASELNVPFLSVPTTASHDGIASPVASFKEGGKPVSITTKAPIAVIADLEIIESCPRRLIHSGFGDLISNITAVKDWRLSRDLTGESYNEVAASIATIPAYLLIAKANGEFDLIKDLELLLRGLIMSGVAIAMVGSSRPASGAEHKFSHALDYLGYGNATHGEQVGLGTIIFEFMYEEKYGDGDWKAIKSALKKAGAPVRLSEVGITKDQAIEALMFAKKIRRKRFTILEATDPKKEDFERVLRETEML
ncbi:MAG: iron-containing alcohol dehydrogenase [Archaeoglobus sp.]|jgi:glycerol-1-phosphate dehydrogenase [NAD(P)+]|nr:iron-containing alcohol dehydrogenase [Archaeoglobus sp.]